MVVPAVLAIFGFFIMKSLIFNLIDEVYDRESHLLCRRKGIEVKVNLTDIERIRFSNKKKPPRIIVHLRHPTELGDELQFLPKTNLIPFRKNADIEMLFDRIHKARKKNRSSV